MDTYTRKEVSEITGIPDRRLLFYTEQNVLPMFVKNVGRGVARKYSKNDVLLLLLLKELDALGVSLQRASLILNSVWSACSLPPGVGKYLPKLAWDDLLKKRIYMTVTFPIGPEEHALSPNAKGYDSELFIGFHEGAVTIDDDRPSRIILNLQQIFKRANS